MVTACPTERIEARLGAGRVGTERMTSPPATTIGVLKDASWALAAGLDICCWFVGSSSSELSRACPCCPCTSFPGSPFPDSGAGCGSSSTWVPRARKGIPRTAARHRRCSAAEAVCLRRCSAADAASPLPEPPTVPLLANFFFGMPILGSLVTARDALTMDFNWVRCAPCARPVDASWSSRLQALASMAGGLTFSTSADTLSTNTGAILEGAEVRAHARLDVRRALFQWPCGPCDPGGLSTGNLCSAGLAAWTDSHPSGLVLGMHTGGSISTAAFSTADPATCMHANRAAATPSSFCTRGGNDQPCCSSFGRWDGDGKIWRFFFAHRSSGRHRLRVNQQTPDSSTDSAAAAPSTANMTV